MSDIKILWADDEIDLLKPQILFLEQKGYSVEPVSNGHDALDKCKSEHFDLIFLESLLSVLFDSPQSVFELQDYHS